MDIIRDKETGEKYIKCCGSSFSGNFDEIYICNNCGREYNDGQIICPDCNCDLKLKEIICKRCGDKITYLEGL